MQPLKLPISLHERYDRIIVNRIATAPLTQPPAKYMFAIDRKEFAKLPGEKQQLQILKAQLPKARHHKFVTQFKGIF